MARTARFAVALRGASVGLVAIDTDAARTGQVHHVSAEPENDADYNAIAEQCDSTSALRAVAANSAVAAALWRSLSDESRARIADAEPELAAELDAATDAAARKRASERIDARAAADAAARSRREPSRLPDSE